MIALTSSKIKSLFSNSILLVILLVSVFPLISEANNNLKTSYYLVEDLDSISLSAEDKALLKECLINYHKAESDTGRIDALSPVTQLMASDEWMKYQFFQLALINKAFKKDNDEATHEKLSYSYADAVNNVGVIFHYKGELDSSIVYYNKALKMQKALKNETGIGHTTNNLGMIYKEKGEIQKSIAHFESSEKTFTALNNVIELATANINLSGAYYDLGDMEKAMNYLKKALLFAEKGGDKLRTASCLSNMGQISNEQGFSKNALSYFQKAYDIRLQVGHKYAIANSLGLIASWYLQQEDTILALDFYKRSLQIRTDIEDALGVSSSSLQLGGIYMSKGDYKVALDYITTSLDIAEKTQSKKVLISSLLNIGKLYMLMGNLAESERSLTKALRLSEDSELKKSMAKALMLISNLNKKQGDYSQSLEYYKRYVKLKDEMLNDETRKNTLTQQLKYQIEKSQIIEREKLEVEKAKKERMMTIYIGLGIIILLILGFFVFLKVSRLQQSKKVITANLKTRKNDLTQVVADNRMRSQLKENMLNTLNDLHKEEDSSIRMLLKGIIIDLKQQIQTEEKHNVLQDNIGAVNKEFEEKLKTLYPGLSQTEIEICSLIKLNLNIREIASIRNTTDGAIKSYRHRIRKKMNLESQDLSEAINKL